MNIVINIDDDKYKEIKKDVKLFKRKGMVVPYLYKVIESGIPLPKLRTYSDVEHLMA